MLKHIAIIADGNRRWAKLHNLPISHGYLEGLNTIETVCEWAIEKQIPYLTFYCFSTENWNRPPKEIDTIMSIGSKYII
jgi:undecaprenyl diphosphate synthase